MKKKNKDQARKSITAVGAVVAAGLTPGIVTGTPLPEPLSSDINLTAADVISINGEMYDFEDMFAMNQADSVPVDQIVVVYGSPKAMKKMKKKEEKKKKEEEKRKKEEEKKKKDKDQEIREQEIADSLMMEEMKKAEEDRLARERYEAWRRDSIQRAIEENHKLVYGPPPPMYHFVGPVKLRDIAARDQQEAFNVVVSELRDFCSTMIFHQAKDPTVPLERRDISRDLGMETDQLETLERILDDHYSVQATKDMIKKLGTLEGVAKFIVNVATPIKKED